MMEQHAQAIVCWPSMSMDIRNTGDRCADCNRKAFTQAATLPLPTAPPSNLFEVVFTDFFTYGGRHYLVVAITLWSVITFLAGLSFLDPQQAHLSQALLASFATSIPSSPGLVYQKNFPAMVVQNSLQDVQRLSSISGEYDIMHPWPTSLSPVAEQRSQVSQAPSYVQQ